jgi:hypothetical protein
VTRLSVIAAVAAVALCTLPLAGCTLDPEAGMASSSPSESAAADQTSSPSAHGGDEPDSTATPSAPTTAPDDDGDTSLALTTTSDATGESTGGDIGTLADIRLGNHGDVDRVVIELEGPGVPGWHVGYVAEPIGDPSGIRVDVDGAAVLQVLLDPVGYPEDGKSPYRGPQTVSVSDTAVVREAVLSSIFEGELQLFVGLSERRPFRVYGMTNPARVVIEVAHVPDS